MTRGLPPSLRATRHLRRNPAAVPPWTVPVLSVMAGSLLAIVPVIAPCPVLPPMGLMLLVGWRLLRPDLLRVWAPLPLGLFDDLLSGQPLGSAMLLWTICFLTIDLIDHRLPFRDFRQDWLIGAGAIGFTLSIGRLAATPLRAPVDVMLTVQIAAAVLLFPATIRLVAIIDHRERRR